MEVEIKRKNRYIPYCEMQKKYDLFYEKLTKDEQYRNFMQKYKALSNKLKDEENY
jgi:hypothetical protein